MLDIRLQTPFSCVLAGPSNSGKTTLLSNILREKRELFSTIPDKTRLYFSIYQPVYTTLKNQGLITDCVEGVPEEEDLVTFQKSCSSSLVIFDDLAEQLTTTISNLFVAGSHHYNTSVILLSQNLFQKNPIWRVCSLNATYLILMKNPRDPSQLAVLSRQSFPGRKNFLSEVCKYRGVYFTHTHISSVFN